jgi:hypothetical protein
MTPVKLVVAAIAACVFVVTATATADQWSDRTILSFSSPVMIPGATLPAGKYVFELADTAGNRHLVRVLNAETNKVMTLTQAVPITRPGSKGDVVVQFNPTEPGSAPAVKSWFYPASRYGHEFVYPEEQARHIAERTKTVVLSVDVPGTDLERGVLRTFNPSGQRADWTGDEATIREWESWRRSRAAADRDERVQGSAPAVNAQFEGTRVTLDDLEDNPSKYLGQRISVDAEIEEVYGPRLFTIDEHNWGDLDGEILVLMHTPLAALVNDDDQVTITGTMKPFVRTEVEREWGWLGLDPEVEVEVGAKPILVAERIIGGDNNVALVIDTTVQANRAVGTSGVDTAAGSKVSGTASTAGAANSGGTANTVGGVSPGAGADAPISDPARITGGDEQLVGRQLHMSNLKVTGTAAAGGGFFVAIGDQQLYVLPAQKGRSAMNGETVGIYGLILRMPRSMEERLKPPAGFNDDIYVYATTIVK